MTTRMTKKQKKYLFKQFLKMKKNQNVKTLKEESINLETILMQDATANAKRIILTN